MICEIIRAQRAIPGEHPRLFPNHPPFTLTKEVGRMDGAFRRRLQYRWLNGSERNGHQGLDQIVLLVNEVANTSKTTGAKGGRGK
jgi:hypothetical protein